LLDGLPAQAPQVTIEKALRDRTILHGLESIDDPSLSSHVSFILDLNLQQVNLGAHDRQGVKPRKQFGAEVRQALIGNTRASQELQECVAANGGFDLQLWPRGQDAERWWCTSANPLFFI